MVQPVYAAYRMFDGNGREVDSAAIPGVLVTGTTHPRLRVDMAQTSFWEGREFRSFKELSIAGTSTYTIKAVVPVNTILMAISVILDNGSLRMSTQAGGTPGGVFAETLPVFGANNMTGTPVYVPQNALTAGGTLAGGTDIDVVRVFTGNNNSASVGSQQDDVRGIAPGTYHFVLLNLGASVVTGVLHLRWEERP